MVQVSTELIVAGAILLVLAGLLIRSSTYTGTDTSTETAGGDQNPQKRFNPDVATWDEEPPAVGSERNQHPETPRDPQSGTSHHQTKSIATDFTELDFGWETNVDITFDDVGGMADLKQELRMDIIYPLETDTDLFESMGITVPNVLFHGPPGTGKTYMARALAGELDVPFAELSGSTLQSKWINESATLVQTLFSEAKMIAETHGGALIFIDELDSVLRARTAGENAHAEDSKVVTEFLTQLQTTDDHDIVFVGATNRAEILDEASIRQGRIDKHVEIPLPDQDAREAILQVQLDTRPHRVTEANMAHAARQLEGASAAAISSLVESAARHAVYARGGDTIRWGDLQMATEEFLTTRQS